MENIIADIEEIGVLIIEHNFDPRDWSDDFLKLDKDDIIEMIRNTMRDSLLPLNDKEISAVYNWLIGRADNTKMIENRE